MNKLPVPLLDVDVVDIFETCVNGYEDEDKKERLLRYSNKVFKSAELYPQYIPLKVSEYPDFEIKDGDTKIIENVYSEKFSKSTFTEGRAYYDKIRSSTGGRCAVCDIGAAHTLDHYLPKSKFPLLCVFPGNLVPECQSCNKNKGRFFEEDISKMLLHPYFDTFLDEVWVDVELTFGKTIICKYYNSYSGDEVTKSRITITIKKYKIDELYSLQANSEIENNKLMWKAVLSASGVNGFLSMLKMSKKGREQVNKNSWAAALYRALVLNIDLLSKWLRELDG